MSPGAIKAPAFFDPISQAKLSGGQTGREEEEDGAQHACSDARGVPGLRRHGHAFGKKHMFDASEETCWNSDQGSSQWVTLDFPSTVRISQLHIQFQGGFSSRLCTLEGCRAGEEPVKISNLYPEDTNAMQRFQVEETELDKLKITFENSTDFFGRIVVYHLGVLGQRL
ncbi:nuclear receptor 2C2-associated protein [Columba livia]|uniref:Nuclear receptor 2C2-associated protein n=1 Tax=Columba livia TaxID=8932 RepID=A0A2I0LPX5_COLLI|nr:nuclear receptor 2C2-associated protein [Columba livia]PKK19481.1 nuclear receptor 2C2-associated protein [Columba livia]